MTQAIFNVHGARPMLTNSMGYRVVTCNTAVMRIDGFADAIVHLRHGRGDVCRPEMAPTGWTVAQGTKDALRLSLITATVLVTLLLLFGGTLIRMFTTTEEIIALGTRQIHSVGGIPCACSISSVR